MGCAASAESSKNDEVHNIRRQSARMVAPAYKGNTNSWVNEIHQNQDKMDEFPPPNSKDVSVDKSTLDAYLEIEKLIAEKEANNPLQPLDLKSDQLQRLTEEISKMEIGLEKINKELKELKPAKRNSKPNPKTKSKSKEVSSSILHRNTFSKQTEDEAETHKVFIDNGIQDDPLTPTKENYLDAVNKKEIAKRELEAAKKQKEQVSAEVSDLEKRTLELQDLYKRQDELLDRLFGGEYGSTAENQLEQELDHLEAHRGRILEANFKWRQAQMMLEYACKQLAVAVQKWQDLPSIPHIDLEIRYSTAAETRNNLVAAGQNITGAQRYLENVQFPYCAPNEVETLNKATEYVFTDMQSEQRHQHANQCYDTTHKRAGALLQWFDTVINSTIMKDLTEINEKVKAKTLELRRERVRLIQTKIKEIYGTDVELDETLRAHDINFNAMSHVGDDHVIKVDGGDIDGARAGTPPLLSSDQLAPMPSNTMIFGKMYDHYQDQLESLAKQHQDELQLFMKEQEANQKRIRGNLEDKLMARRQRRARMRVEEAQKSMLTS